MISSAQKDQLLEICPVAAVRQANHMRRIERPARRCHIHQHPVTYGRLWTLQDQAPNVEPEQIFSLRCQNRTCGQPRPTAKLFSNDFFLTNPLNTRFGGAGRDRTDDPLLAKQVLSQLSYGP